MLTENQHWLAGDLPINAPDVVALVWSLYKRSRDNKAGWRERAAESYDYYNGEPYTLWQEEKMKTRKTPALQINRIFPQVRDKKALAIRGLPEIKCYPRGLDDTDVADDMNELVKYVQYENNMMKVQDIINQDAIITGEGWLKCIFDDTAGEDFPDIQMFPRSPFIMFKDPDSEREDLVDAEYVIEAQRLPIGKIIRMFPDKKELIFPSGSFDPTTSPALEHDIVEDDYGSHGMGQEKTDKEEPSALLLECWIKEHKPGAIYYDPTTEMYINIELDKDGDPIIPAKYSKDKEQYLAWFATLVHVKNLQHTMRLIHVVGNVLLQNKPMPYMHNTFPFVPLYCYVSRDESGPKVFGEVDNAKEPQLLHNKFFSLALHSLATGTNFMWLKRKDVVDEGKLERDGSTPGAVIDVDVPPGMALNEAVQRIPGVPLSPELGRMMELLKYEIDRMTGVFQPQRGEAGTAKSGKQVELQMDQGQVAVEGLTLNASAFRKQTGRIIVSNIQQFWQGKDMVQVIGPDGARRLIDMQDGNLKDLATMKFDIVIADTRGQPTTALEKFAIAEKIFPAVLSPEEFMEYVPLPNKEEVIQRIKTEREAMLGITGGMPAPEGEEVQ
jgi:hypothetical protein